MRLSSFFSFRFKYKVLFFLQQFKSFQFFSKNILKDEGKKAFFFLAADYGNLGDCAITVAQTEFVNKNSDFKVVEIPISQTAEGIYFVKKNIKSNDIVITVGGGNMGEMYDQIEFLRQLVIKKFPKNKIISFPQTFDFSENSIGQKALEKAKKVYNKHRDLHLIAREETSYQKMKENFSSVSIYKTPDIVLSLDKSSESNRNSAVICMRSDAEKKLTKEQSEIINNIIFTKYNEVKNYDTHIHRSYLTVEERQHELDKIWSAFRSSEIVFTDRLHGMIFCHITGTPAVVFQNSNHKIRETYEWIKENKSITLIADFDENHISEIITYNNHVKSINLKIRYQPLIDLLK